MGQVKNENLELYGEIEKECRVCKEEKKKSIFYHYDDKNYFYICEECFGVIEALYIDVLLENEENNNVLIEDNLNRLNKKIKNIKKWREENSKI